MSEGKVLDCRNFSTIRPIGRYYALKSLNWRSVVKKKMQQDACRHGTVLVGEQQWQGF
jgi:hypothetical protein